MDNITIGIVTVTEQINNKSFECIVSNNLKYLNNKCNYIGIMLYDKIEKINTKILDKCDGIIFQGGTIMYPYYFQILNYAYKNNIPVLGICMGFQLIGLFANKQEEKDLINVKNHLNTYHDIIINQNSILYKLFSDKIKVNSRHNYTLKFISDPFIIGAYSEDGTIEEIEYIDDNHFIIGLQFHPEDLDNMDILYNFFIKECYNRKK